MQYKKNYDDVIRRLNDLYSGKGQDKIYAKMDVPNPIIEKLKKKNKDGEVEYPNILDRISFWNEYLSIYTTLEDDSIPSCYLSEFDEGLYGGILGLETRFILNTETGWISSMTVPSLKDINDFTEIKIKENNFWVQRYKKQLDLFIREAENKFGISHFILIDGLNLLFELRGATNTYYDLIDNPEKVNELIEFSYRLNIWVQDYFFDKIGLYNGGTVSNIVQWIPGRIISESLDPFHLTSVDIFEKWGRELVEKTFSHFDGGIIHLHSNGRRLIKTASSIKGLKCIVLLDEDFAEPAYKKIETFAGKRGEIPMVVFIPFEVFVDKLRKRELPPNILYQVTKVPDINTANKIMGDVKKYKI